MSTGKEDAGDSQSSITGLNKILAAGIVCLIVGYVLGIQKSAPQYAVILGMALLCFVTGLVIVMRHFATKAKSSSRTFHRSSAWVVSTLMAASAALLVWGAFVD
jgi:di/tricarboxylate transporter